MRILHDECVEWTRADYEYCLHRVLMKKKPEVTFDSLDSTVYLLRNALKSLRIKEHYECEDGWYSCPKAENYNSHCDDDDERGCECGMDSTNKKIDNALKQTEWLVVDA